MERTTLSLAPELLVEELSAMLGDSDPRHVVLAFDGDGTLWSGDVGENLFHAALREAFLREDATAALIAEAEHHGIALGDARRANAIAQVLFQAYLAGTYPERETCAMMTWCYAGHTVSAVHAFADRVLGEEGLATRMHPELDPILSWCDRANVRRVLVSASPRMIVEPAGALRGFAALDVTAATPAIEAGSILPRMAKPVPYADGKLSAGRELFGDARWLAAFGDNVFDIEMLTTAEVGVAVRPKPRLAAQLPALGLRSLEPR